MFIKSNQIWEYYPPIYSKYISSPKISHNNQETEKKAVLFPTLSNTNTKAFAHL